MFRFLGLSLFLMCFFGVSGFEKVEQNLRSQDVQYLGGKVINKPRIISVQFQPSFRKNDIPDEELSKYLHAIAKGPFIDFLSEYNTPSQSFKDGAAFNTFVVYSDSLEKVLDNELLKGLLKAAFIQGVPRPAPDNVYVISLPKDSVASLGGGSCHVQDNSILGEWCGIHGSWNIPGEKEKAYYIILPQFENDACAARCSAANLAAAPRNAAFTTASRQLASLLTNPDGGVGITGWDNSRFGDIGEQCTGAGFVKLADGKRYIVSELYSNEAGKCVVP